jgi:hypothetical protein
MTTTRANQILVCDDPHISDIWSGFDTTFACSNEEVQNLYATVKPNCIWIAPRYSDMLMLGNIVGNSRGNHCLLCLEPTDGTDQHYLNAKFSLVVSPDDGLKLLPIEEIAEIIGLPDSEDYIIGGIVNLANSSVVLYRGNLAPITLPLAWFEAGPNSPQPNPDDFEIIDFGQTIRMGEFEAGTEAILYEFDPLFRRRDKERRINTDDSFGGALRRLRLQRGLKQSDFSPGTSTKEVGRIERGEVATLHERTIENLAQHLGVAPEEIQSY